MRVPHHVGRLVADKIVEGLAPHCERIEIAGSLRRLRPTIGDIDLVAIPRFTSSSALFGAGALAETDFMAALLNAAFDGESDGTEKAVCTGEKIVRLTVTTKKFGLRCEVPRISLDVYIATPESWATLLLVRTGSAEHNIWLAQRAKACGGKLHADGSGLELPGQYDPLEQRVVNMRVVRAQSEEEIFKALGLPLPFPADRECKDGLPIWLPGRAT